LNFVQHDQLLGIWRFVRAGIWWYSKKQKKLKTKQIRIFFCFHFWKKITPSCFCQILKKNKRWRIFRFCRIRIKRHYRTYTKIWDVKFNRISISSLVRNKRPYRGGGSRYQWFYVCKTESVRFLKRTVRKLLFFKKNIVFFIFKKKQKYIPVKLT
jgi:hypothetical protein